MKQTLSLLLILFGAIGAYSSAYGHYVILPPEYIQQTAQAPLRERLLVYPNNLIQVPTFFDRSGLVHLKNVEPDYAGQAYPSYDGNAPVQDMQPPVEPKVDPAGQQPVTEDRLQTDVETIGTPVGGKMGKIEFEPDAELIPDSIPRNSPPTQPQPVAPSVPASPYPGLLPGTNFYYPTGPHVVTYPQAGAPIQPTFRFPSAIGGYPRQFFYFGQPTYQTQPGQTVFLVNNPSSYLLRSNQVQKLDVPALGYLRKSPSVSFNEEEQNQNVENFNVPQFESRISADESNEEKSDVSKVENTQPEDSSKSLQSEKPALKKTDIDNDAVVIEADKNAPSKKAEIVHEDLKSTPPLAKSNPTAVAVAGEGGSAQSAPKGSAIAGPSGLAVSNPIATALAGDYNKKSDNKP